MRAHPLLESLPVSSCVLWHVGEGYSVVRFHHCNYGASYILSENPHHKTQLALMVCLMHSVHGAAGCGPTEDDVVAALQGLRQDTIFGCLYEYLFDPLPEVKEMFRTELAVMQDSTLKIAIQV